MVGTQVEYHQLTSLGEQLYRMEGLEVQGLTLIMKRLTFAALGHLAPKCSRESCQDPKTDSHEDRIHMHARSKK